MQAGLPIVLAVLVATALLPAPASADHGEPHHGLDILCDESGECKIVDVCGSAFITICVDLSEPNAAFVEADPSTAAFGIQVDSYKKPTPAGADIFVTCIKTKPTVYSTVNVNQWVNGCNPLTLLGFEYAFTVLPWTSVERIVDRSDIAGNNQVLLESCTAEVTAIVAGTGVSDNVNVPCNIGG